MSFPRVLIVGAAGTLGSRVLTRLLASPSITKLTIITRTDSTSTFPSDLNVIKVASYEDEAALTTAFANHDVLLSFVGGLAGYKVDVHLLAAAIAAGVKRFFPSEYTLDVTNPWARELAGDSTLGALAKNADILRDLANEGKIEYTTLVTGGLLDWGLNAGFLGFDVPQCKAVLYDGGKAFATGCTMDFVARAVETLLRMPAAETKNRRVKIAEVRYTGAEILGLFEDVTGKKWSVTESSTAQLTESARIAQQAGDAMGRYVGYILTLNFDGKGAGDFPEDLQWSAQGEFEIQRKSLREVVEDAVKGVQ